MPFYIALYLCRILSDRDAKERLIGLFFRDEPLEQISAHSDWFCSEWIVRCLRPDTVKKLREHQDAGHRVVLVSASPDLFVPQVGRFLGINETICTPILFENGSCSGKFAGPNCKGTNKVTMLTSYLNTDTAPEQSYAYGDSRSDFPLLRWVRFGNLVQGTTSSCSARNINSLGSVASAVGPSRGQLFCFGVAHTQSSARPWQPIELHARLGKCGRFGGIVASSSQRDLICSCIFRYEATVEFSHNSSS